jgi:hypothetical protein
MSKESAYWPEAKQRNNYSNKKHANRGNTTKP